MDIQEALEGLEMSMTKRLTCELTPNADLHLRQIITDMEINKGKTIAKLMELARDNPDFQKAEYVDTGKDVTSTLNAADDWLATFKPYRGQYGLHENTAFFKDILIRGISIYRDRNPDIGKNSG